MQLKNKSMLNNSVTRKSGIELLKVFAILVICMSHCIQTLEGFVDFSFPVANAQLLIMKILRFGGDFGNAIFIICSSYFLLKSSHAKKEKSIGLLLDSQVISVVIFIGYIIIGAIFSIQTKHEPSFILLQFLPDLYENVWFVPTYFMFYLIHPYLNQIIKSLDQKNHFKICLFIITVYGVFSLLNATPVYSLFLGFICIYFLVAYMSLYCEKLMNNKKINIFVFVASCFLFICAVFVKNFLSEKNKFFDIIPKFSFMLSIILLPIFFSLFNLALNTSFKSRFINYLSSCSLFVYCIHENYIVRKYLRTKYYAVLIDRFGENYLIYALILFVIVVIGSFIAAAVYKQTIHKIIQKISVKLSNFIGHMADSLYEKLS